MPLPEEYAGATYEELCDNLLATYSIVCLGLRRRRPVARAARPVRPNATSNGRRIASQFTRTSAGLRSLEEDMLNPVSSVCEGISKQSSEVLTPSLQSHCTCNAQQAESLVVVGLGHLVRCVNKVWNVVFAWC